MTTTLESNPFFMLGVTTRDNRHTIIERAEEQALHSDPEACQKARSDLTNPRARLSAEVRWLPGVSPRMAEKLVRSLVENPLVNSAQTGLPEISRTNLMASAMELLNPETTDSKSVADFIQVFATVADRIDPETVMRDINEDRMVAGFPEVRDSAAIEEEIHEQKKIYRTVLKNAFNEMPSSMLIETMDLLVNEATSAGESPAPTLIDDLVDSYELEVQPFLNKEKENIEKLLEVAKQNAAHGPAKLAPVLAKLHQVTMNWCRVAHPIQVSLKSRGVDHRDSSNLAISIRSLGIDLYNTHKLMEPAERVTKMLLELFHTLPNLTDKVQTDADTLNELRKDAEQSEQKNEAWGKSITYRGEIGLVFKDELSISPSGIRWKDDHYDLKKINGIRWGAVRNSVNGIPTGTEYTIAFGDDRKSSVVSLNRESVYSSFVDCLWKAVGVRLLIELCEALKAGKTVNFGGISVRDSSFGVERHRFLATNETVWLNHNEAHVWSADGSFFLGSTTDNKVYASSSYISHWNTHVLEQLVRSSFKNGTKGKLSAIFES